MKADFKLFKEFLFIKNIMITSITLPNGNQKSEKFKEKLIYMIQNKQDYLECNFEKKIKLQKNVPFIINFNRCYDLYSDLIFEYDRGVKIEFIKLTNLPDEINDVIKSYLIPKCNVDIFLGQGNLNCMNILKKAEEVYNDDKNIVKKKIYLNMINHGQKFFSFTCNHLPLQSIQYHEVALQVVSDQDCYLTVNLKGTILNDERIRKEIVHNKYMYYGKNKIAIMNGMIGSMK